MTAIHDDIITSQPSFKRSFRGQSIITQFQFGFQGGSQLQTQHGEGDHSEDGGLSLTTLASAHHFPRRILLQSTGEQSFHNLKHLGLGRSAETKAPKMAEP